MGKYFASYFYAHRWTGHSDVVVFATWTACFRVILGPVAYKIEWGKAKKGDFVRFVIATPNSHPVHPYLCYMSMQLYHNKVCCI